jgi:isopentenyl diphosphate isomerase/L-lactate dehydrogenase-like FMN-dependent dehydrogenase
MLHAELLRAMALAGAASIAEVDRSLLLPAGRPADA